MITVAVLKQANTFFTAMAAIEWRGTDPNSPTYDKSATPTRLERAQTYEDAILPVPSCGEKP